jgi:outer membrane lipoprotein-sorting protein
MKKRITLLCFLAFLMVKSSEIKAQCDPIGYTETCISKLTNGFTFLKSFKIDGENGDKNKVEYSYVFSKDTQYFINICSPDTNTDGIVVTMYDSQRNQVGTNLVNNNFYPGFVYPCNATGIYYITFTFRDSKSFCGGSTLGFKR